MKTVRLVKSVDIYKKLRKQCVYWQKKQICSEFKTTVKCNPTVCQMFKRKE